MPERLQESPWQTSGLGTDQKSIPTLAKVIQKINWNIFKKSNEEKDLR